MPNYNRNNDPQGNSKKPVVINSDFFNPYAFVPLSETVFNLTDREKEQLKNAQDIPFSDGTSGSVEVIFKAVTPFCVRCGENGSNARNKDYYVPATSLKGMIRNVFEIISFANIKNGMANSRYSMPGLKSNDKSQNSGFLIQLNENFYIIPCDSFPFSYEEIKKVGYQIDCDKFKNLKTAEKKYNALKDKNSNPARYIYRTKDVDQSIWMWFFSGSMSNKEHEFLFKIPQFEKDDLIKLEEKEYKDFIFIHQIENENESWKFWKNKLKNYSTLQEIVDDGYKGIIPCFFRTKQNGKGGNIVRDLGFSYLYRQPYDKTTHDCLPGVYKNDTFDLAQAVFGYTGKNASLKGRVQFSNAIIKDAKVAEKQTFVLGSPKPTFYPFYLKQNVGELNTYFSPQATISGWKRPLLHKTVKIGKSTGNTKIESEFTPLEAGTEFTTQIKFHNLRPYELGALIAAITFCGKSDKCYHSLGYAKAFGYGKLKVQDVKLNIADKLEEYSIDSLIECFENKLFSQPGITKEKWINTLSSLFLYASGEYKEDKEIKYPSLKRPSDSTNADFTDIKKKGMSIKDFTPKLK